MRWNHTAFSSRFPLTANSRLAEKEWRMPPREWAMAKAQFAILFEDRLRAA